MKRALLLVLLTSGCFGLDEQEQAVLDVHQQNSQMFFQSGSWQQALHQADMALKLDDDLLGMRLIKALCLTRLGTGNESREQINGAIAIFDDVCNGDGAEDYRSWLGSGQAHLARARLLQHEVERIDRRLGSDFLTEQGRRDETADRVAVNARRLRDLEFAERHLRRVLEFPIQRDNVYAMIDLTLTLLEGDGREDEAAVWGRRAVALLQDAVALTRETVSKNMNLSPRGRINLQQRIEEYLDKEAMLRGLIITIEFNRGSFQRCLEEYAALEARSMMDAAHYHNRALVYERLGMWSEAIADLEAFLRERSRDQAYDGQVEQVFDRIDVLEQHLADEASG